MAFNQDLAPYRQEHHLPRSVESSISAPAAKNYDELSSSGVDSDWILFSPSMNEYAQRSGKEHDSDVLSTSANDEDEVVFDAAPQVGATSQENVDDDDDESLLDSLNTDSPIKLSFPTHDSASFNRSHIETEEDNYITSLKNNDFVTNRIDNWRREQARLMINDLAQGSDTESTLSHANDLLASWGVDDRHLAESTNSKNVETEKYKYSESKRFYGDELFQHLTPWEVQKIKTVATQMSSSLHRRHKFNDQQEKSIFHQLSRGSTGGRLLLLLSLPKYSANKFSMSLERDQPFWKRDLSSAQSSLSLSTNSIMFGNMHLGDVMWRFNPLFIRIHDKLKITP